MDMEVMIWDFDPAKAAEIIEKVVTAWDVDPELMETEEGRPNWLRLTSEDCRLYEGETEQSITDELYKAAVLANGGPCKLEFTVSQRTAEHYVPSEVES